MAALKVIKGTTPSFTMAFRDAENAVVDPTGYDKIEIFLYNIASGRLVAAFTTESPTPDGWDAITATSTEIEITIPSDITHDAESGDNRIEIWTYLDPITDCSTSIFNEFIDAKNAL